jgi:hypothetical protein
MRLILNEDDSHFYVWPNPEKITDEAHAFVDLYAQAGITELFLCVNAQRASYDSRIFDPIWTGFDPQGGLDQPYFAGITGESENIIAKKNFFNWALNARQVNGDGKNVYCDWIQRSRELGVSPWISMRMNDIHCVDNEQHPIHSSFWRNHPERRRVGYRFKEWQDKALDFGREDVREYSLALIREIAELYDMDGLELDWMRFGFHFRPGFEQAGVPLLTAFTKEARNILDAAEQKRGHRIQLAARVPSRPETALGLGMDAVSWAREGLIDLLVVTPFWATAETDMPIEIWKQLLWGSKTKLAAGLEILFRPFAEITELMPDKANANILNSIETVRGMAWSYINRGVDAVYLFNYMALKSDNESGNQELIVSHALVKEIGQIADIEKMRGKSRRHVVTYADTWAPGEPSGKLLPAKLKKDGWSAFRIHIGEASPEQPAYVVISILDGGTIPDIWINGTKCEKSDYKVQKPPIAPGTNQSYRIPSGVLHDGHNLVEATGADCEIIWVEINVAEHQN